MVEDEEIYYQDGIALPTNLDHKNNDWNSVKDRLPKRSHTPLLISCDGDIHMAYFLPLGIVTDHEEVFYCHGCFYEPDHWMHIPCAPVKEKNK